MKPLTIGVSAFCCALDIGRTTAFKLIRERQIASILVGRKRLITLESVDAFIAQRRSGPSPVNSEDQA